MRRSSSPEEVPLQVRVSSEWITLPNSSASAIRVRRALSSSGRPYDTSSIGCDPADLRREFHLPKTEYLLGEPIVVEMSVMLEGPGRWGEKVGGNYRCHGRDDNFCFLMRSLDGSWVADPYEPERVCIGGGLGYRCDIERGKPLSKWLAVQRWAAIQQPGVYDLFAIQFDNQDRVEGYRAAVDAAIASRFGSRWKLAPDGESMQDGHGNRRRLRLSWEEEPLPSPVVARMPVQLRSKLGNCANVADFGVFRIVIRPGIHEETSAMVLRSTQLADSCKEHDYASCARATREAIWFARQDCFLARIASWMRNGDPLNDYAGLAMNPSATAESLLFSQENSPIAVNAFWHLPSERLPRAIPVLISRLTNRRPEVRDSADRCLEWWTGLRFSRRRIPFEEHISPEEALELQAIWLRWWAEESKTFRPKVR